MLTHQLVDVAAEPHRDHDGAAPSHTHNRGTVNVITTTNMAAAGVQAYLKPTVVPRRQFATNCGTLMDDSANSDTEPMAEPRKEWPRNMYTIADNRNVMVVNTHR